MRSPLVRSLGLAALALGLGACGGTGGGGGGDSASSAQFLVGSTGDTDLFALSAELTEIRLIRDDGTPTANLLPAPTRVEFVGLQDVAEWLMGVAIEPGTYTRIEVGFDPNTVEATTTTGTDVALSVLSSVWELEFDRPVTLASGSGERVELVLDLNESIAGDVVPAPPTFLPVGDVYASSGGDGDGERGLDHLRGIVVAAALRDMTFALDVYHDEGMDDSMGKLLVHVNEDTLLVDDNGVTFPNAEAFFASLRIGMTVVEVGGGLDDQGTLQADRVVILDQAGGDGRPPIVQIQGMVLHVFGEDELGSNGDRGQFVLLIRRILEGADIAEPVLAGIGDPSSIDVAYDDSTRIVGPFGTELPREALRVGQIVDVSFEDFVEPPFLASKIEIEEIDACFAGYITEVDAEAGQIVILLDDDDREMHENDLDGHREVLVDLTGAETHLSVRQRPSLEVSELVTGMKIVVCGTLEHRPGDMEGDPDQPVIVGRKAALHPGHLIMGVPSEIDVDACSFTLRSGRIVQPFGDLVTGLPLNVLIDEDAYFRGDADSKEAFFRLFESLQPGESLDVKIKGIGSGEPDEVVGFELKVRLVGSHGDGDDHPGGDDATGM